jgi:biopolymer transport protein ExbB
MATKTNTTAPVKKSQGFQGVKAAFWIIVVCFILAVLFFKFFLGSSAHIDPNNGEVIDGNIWGTIYKVVSSFLSS